jgi:sugar/nucleoside kinase (ribokinase family)
MEKRLDNPLPRIVVAGHLCLDIFPDLSNVPEGQFMQLFRPGHLVSTGPAAFATGGAASNTGLALARLGMPVQLVAKVGDDPFAEIVRGVIRSYGPNLEEGIVTTPGVPTSYSVIISPPGIDRIFLHCTGANDTLVSADVNYPLVENAAIFHFGYPPLLREFYRHEGRELVDLFQRVKQTGATTSLDLTLPDPASEAGQVNWPAILGATLPDVDIFLPSVEEILFMLRPQTYKELQEAAGNGDLIRKVTPDLLDDLSAQLLAMGAKIVGLKLGACGFYLRTTGESALAGLGRGKPSDPAAWANRTLWAPCYQVNVVGTTGAGDSAIAGFLSGLLRGLGPRAALAMAAAVGACNVEAADALSGLRSWEDTLARVAAGWEQVDLGLPPEDWQRDPDTGIWTKIKLSFQ